jgi:hypothetical protein
VGQQKIASAAQAGTISRYSTGESAHKSRAAVGNASLDDCMQESNTIREKYEFFSGAWEKSAAADSAEPNSKEILLGLRQLFVDAKILSPPIFCQRPYFVDPSILLTPVFCWRQYFVDANILSTSIFCQCGYFCWEIIFCRRWYFC